jgi:predicted TIM-barrel fold metal-dependent hydrolase
MIDCHVHIGYDEKTQFSLNQKDLSKKIDQFELDGAVIFSCPNVKIKNEDPFKDANNLVLEASKKDNRLIPFMFVHPFLDSPLYVQNFQDHFKGFKLYPKTVGMEYSYRPLRGEIIDLLGETGKPLLFHTDFREGHRILDLIHLIKRISNPCLLAHCGDLINEDLREASELPNVIIDVSPMATMIERGFYIDTEKRNKKLEILRTDSILDYLFELFGNERIIWGSDSPWCDHLSGRGYESEIEILRKMEERGLKTPSFLK